MESPLDAERWERLLDRRWVVDELASATGRATKAFEAELAAEFGGDAKVVAARVAFQALTLWFLQELGLLDQSSGERSPVLLEALDAPGSLSYDSFSSFLGDACRVLSGRPARVRAEPPAPLPRVKNPALAFDVDWDRVRLPDEPFERLFRTCQTFDWVDGEVDTHVFGSVREHLVERSLRKKRGTFYTPRSLARRVAARAITSQLARKVASRLGTGADPRPLWWNPGRKEHVRALFHSLVELRACDPAAGSGQFLEAACDVLDEIYEGLANAARALGLVDELVVDGVAILSRAWLPRALVVVPRTLFGVDLDPLAVEVARARLCLSVASTAPPEERARLLDGLSPRLHLGEALSGDVSGCVSGDVEPTADVSRGQVDPFPWRDYLGGGFDVVLGNPPYVRADADDPFHRQLRARLRALARTGAYQNLEGKWDLWVAFLEKGVRHLLSPAGSLGFVVSESLGTAAYARATREWLRRETFPARLEFFDKGARAFPGVGMNPVLLFAEKGWKGTPKATEKVVFLGGTFASHEVALVATDDPNLFRKDARPFLLAPTGELVPLGRAFYVSKGMVLNSDERFAKGEFRAADLLSDARVRPTDRPFTDSPRRYCLKALRFLEWGTDRVPAKLSRPTFPELYAGEKIIKGRMTGAYWDRHGLLASANSLLLKRWCDLRGVDNRSLRSVVAKHADASRELMEEDSERFSYGYAAVVLNSSYCRAHLNSIRRHRQRNYFYPEELRRLPLRAEVPQLPFEFLARALEVLHASSAPPAPVPGERDAVVGAASTLDQVADLVVEEVYSRDDWPALRFLAKRVPGAETRPFRAFETWDNYLLERMTGTAPTSQQASDTRFLLDFLTTWAESLRQLLPLPKARISPARAS